MTTMTRRDPLVDFITHPGEERNLEHKRGIPWIDAEWKGKICKSMMAMANIRDGGVIVIGVSEDSTGTSFVASGMTSEEADTFRPDEVADFVRQHAVPFVDFTLRRIEHDAKTFIVIQVREFDELPVVCRKTGPNKMRSGALYTRTRGKPETGEVSSESELREILDMAVEKSIRHYFARTNRAGLTVDGQASTDAAKFDAQLGDL
jgi:predicted HTH transcriptional regulator